MNDNSREEDSVSYIHKPNKEVVSPEDIAWADSCLIDPEILGSDWISLKGALQQILDLEFDEFSTDSSILKDSRDEAGKRSNSDEGTLVSEPSFKNPELSNENNFMGWDLSTESDTVNPSGKEDVGKTSNDSIGDEIVVVSEPYLQNLFQPDSMDDWLKEIGIAKEGSGHEEDPQFSTENVFKTWNLSGDSNMEKADYLASSDGETALATEPCSKNPFLSNCMEDGVSRNEEGLGFDDSWLSDDNVFKVWDLSSEFSMKNDSICFEEIGDDSESYSRNLFDWNCEVRSWDLEMPAATEDAFEGKPEIEQLDGLISGMGGLSLSGDFW